MYWNIIGKLLLYSVCNLVEKVESRKRNPWLTQEMISKMDERREWKSVKNEEGRKNYSRLKNERTKKKENSPSQGREWIP